MANLKEIRHRIKSVKTTQQMTKAMKMVAAARLRRAQDNIIRLRPYVRKLSEIMDDISRNASDTIDSPYTEVRDVEKVLLVVITSNRGLCGGFNSNVIKLANKHIAENYIDQQQAGNLELLCMGKKAYEFFAKRDFKMVGENHDVYADLTFETVSKVAQQVMDGYEDKKWDKIEIVYNEFKNVVVQNKVVENFLPLVAADLEEGESQESEINADYIFEPGQNEILKTLIPNSLKTNFYKAVLESNAGEQGARMTAMDSATNNADDMLKELRLLYNRARQASITTEILEIVGGAEALAAGS